MSSEQGKWGRFKSGVGSAARTTRDIGALGNSTAQSVWKGLGATKAGGAFRAGVAESFGFQYGGANHANYQGFLGLRETSLAKSMQAGNRAFTAQRAAGKGFLDASRGRMGAMASSLEGKVGAKTLLKAGGSLAAKAIFPAMTIYSMYEGFQEGGVLGAAGAGAEAAVMWGSMKAAGAVLGGSALWVAGGVAAAGYGYYAMGEAAQAHMKRLKHLEMGSAVKDPFGTAATLRSRSIAALNNSSINGRMAIGNEGFLMAESAYSPAFRR